MDKIFCLGLPKTGTTSLHAALECLGYDVKGQTKSVLREIRNGRYESFWWHIERYDAFEGFPWSIMAGRLFERFGAGARYILTVRRSPDAWLTSIRRHMLSRDPFAQLSQPPTPIGRRYPIGFQAEYLDYYKRHNDSVRDLFAVNGAERALLEVCWETGHGWPELCGFLGHPVPSITFPRRNIAADKKRQPFRMAANLMNAYAIALIHRGRWGAVGDDGRTAP